MAIRKIPNITFEDAHIMYRNLAGLPTKFKPAGGIRDFTLLLDEDTALAMLDDGWNVKYLKPREDVEDSEPRPYVKVFAQYVKFPPRIVLINSRGKTVLTEDNINIIDFAEIEKIDLIIRPYNWEVNGNTGVKALVKSMYVTLAEDELELKYAEVRDANPDFED